MLTDVDPAGVGIVCALHDDPFQMAPPPKPTVSQNVAETHDTGPTSADAGTFWECHEVPFQRTANEPASVPPVASQNLGVTHDTEPVPPSVAATGLGTNCRCQDLPLHRAAKERFLPTPF